MVILMVAAAAVVVIAVDDYIMCDVNIWWLRASLFVLYLYTKSMHPLEVNGS